MSRPHIILVHGLWMTGREMFLLHRRLERAGFSVERYRYATINTGLAANVERLRRFVESSTAVSSERVTHLLGHSLGGVLALHLLRLYPELPVDRVVCLGSPLSSSLAAQRTMEYPFGRHLVGQTLTDAVVRNPVGAWSGAQPVGSIAGSRPLGFSHRLTKIPEPHDGMVIVDETKIPGLSDHLVLPVSHTGLVFDRRVAEQTIEFFQHGRFRH